MNLVPESEEDAFLSDIQQLEESLGGREWNVWRCPQDGYQEIMKHDKWLSAVSNCQRCGNRTATSTTQTLRYATQFHTGHGADELHLPQSGVPLPMGDRKNYSARCSGRHRERRRFGPFAGRRFWRRQFEFGRRQFRRRTFERRRRERQLVKSD